MASEKEGNTDHGSEGRQPIYSESLGYATPRENMLNIVDLDVLAHGNNILPQ